MANKILADLGLSPLNKFLLVYWFSLGFIVLDQITNISEITTTLAELGSVAAAIEERDRLDSTRDTAPLRPADDALVVDTTGRTIEAVVNELAEIVREGLG